MLICARSALLCNDDPAFYREMLRARQTLARILASRHVPITCGHATSIPSSNPHHIIASHHTCAHPAMGSAWSAQRKPTNHNAIPLVQTAIHSAPFAKFTDPLCFSILIDEASLTKLASHHTHPRWQLDLEVDVAHLQLQHRLLDVETNLQEQLQQLEVPESAFRQVWHKESISVDALCNIGAIHATLYSDNEGKEELAQVSIIVDFFREECEQRDGIDGIARRVYDVTDLSQHNV